MAKGIAWIGFGEAAYHIAKGIHGNGFDTMRAYDPAKNDALRGETIQRHAAELGITLYDTVAEAIEGVDFVISLTSAKVAVVVAQQVLPHMTAGQFFMDFNSASPDTKREVAALAHPDGVQICDVAVMSAVPLNGHKVPLLISGPGGAEFAKEMTPYEMNIEVLEAEVGGASAVKMIRSVFMKGFPQVMLECMIAAEHFGVTEKMMDSLEGSIGGKTVRQLANQLFCPTVIHAARRGSEMKEVVHMLGSNGLDAQMSQAAYERLAQLASYNIIEEIGPDVKLNYQQVLEKITQHLN